ncbi:MAG TPA: hypothetical protein VIH90_07140 [Candidatus Saccharimonadales bacterium]
MTASLISPEQSIPRTEDHTGDLPTVSFDIRLGKDYKFIDFDYDKYINDLQDSGLSGEEITDTEIVFKHISPLRIFAAFGHYNIKEDRVTVNRNGYGDRSKASVANRTLRHETQHRMDILNNGVST